MFAIGPKLKKNVFENQKLRQKDTFVRIEFIKITFGRWYVIFKCLTLKSKYCFKVHVKPACFFKKTRFFSFFQNDTEKQFQDCSIQKNDKNRKKAS